MSIQKFFTSRSNAEAADFVGQEDRLWFDELTRTIYYSDGVTPGGIPLTSNSSGTSNLKITTDFGNISSTELEIRGGTNVTTRFVGNAVFIDAASSTIATTFETLSKNLNSYPYNINRNGNNQVSSINYTTPLLGEIVKTLSYNDSTLANIRIAGPSLPSVYLKTLTYANSLIVSASYSVS